MILRVNDRLIWSMVFIAPIRSIVSRYRVITKITSYIVDREWDRNSTRTYQETYLVSVQGMEWNFQRSYDPFPSRRNSRGKK